MIAGKDGFPRYLFHTIIPAVTGLLTIATVDDALDDGFEPHAMSHEHRCFLQERIGLGISLSLRQRVITTCVADEPRQPRFIDFDGKRTDFFGEVF